MRFITRYIFRGLPRKKNNKINKMKSCWDFPPRFGRWKGIEMYCLFWILHGQHSLFELGIASTTPELSCGRTSYWAWTIFQAAVDGISNSYSKKFLRRMDKNWRRLSYKRFYSENHWRSHQVSAVDYFLLWGVLKERSVFICFQTQLSPITKWFLYRNQF